VQIENVLGKGFAALHVGHPKGQLFEILLQIRTAFPTRQHITQSQNVIAVIHFVLMSRIHWIIETHSVQEVPSGGAPQIDHHAFVAVVVIQRKNEFFVS
jgi:hypothetical protein